MTGMTDPIVLRVDFGYFVRPAEETGTGSPRVEPCLGYLVDHPDGLLLVDSGMGSHPDVDAHYRPRRRSLSAALDRVGVGSQDIALVVNCHLHFDHCGGNPELAGRPVFTQQFTKTIPNYMARHCVKAGITGWAQVHGWRGNTSLRKRVQYDLYYITHWTPWLDLRILWMTVFHGLFHRNAY